MLLKQFQTNALKELCFKNQLNLLNFVDCLRSQGINHYVSLSQIIVCGDQSSEKNFVLKTISDVFFFVKNNLNIRFFDRTNFSQNIAN